METFLAIIPEMLCLWIIYINVTKRKFKIISTTIYLVILLSLSYITVSILNLEIIGDTIFVVVLSIASYKNSNKIIAMCMMYALLSVLIFVVCGYTSGTIFSLIFNMSTQSVRDNLGFYYLYFLMQIAISFVISRILGYFIHKKIEALTDILKQKLSVYIMIGAFITLLIYLSNIYLSTYISNQAILNVIYTILIIAYFIYLVFAIYAFAVKLQKEIDLEHKAELLEQLQTYTYSLESVYDEVRKFRHDIINIITAMYGYIEDKDFNGLIEYFNTYISPIAARMPLTDVNLDKLKNIKIPEFKGIVSVKLLYAQDLGIHIHIEVFEEITKLNIDLVDLSRIVGILIDNAIDACKGIIDSSISFAAIKRKMDTRLILSNTVNELPPLEKMFQKGFSTKSGNRGIGLYIVQQLIDRNQKSSIQTELDNNSLTFFIDISD